MSLNIHRRFRSFLLTSALIAAASAPALAAEPCDPLFLDGGLLESTRSWIDLACPCAQYDGSEGKGRADFKRCVGGQIKLAIENEGLNKSCKGLLKKMYATSVCGSGDEELAPCVEQRATGKVGCKIRSATDCQERSGDVCFKRPTCIDAADTNGDLVVDANDSGVCFPPPPTTSTTSTTTSTTTTTTTSTLPLLCGDGSPDIVVEVNRDTDCYELVRKQGALPWCGGQTPSGGGCQLLGDLDGSGIDLDGQYLYADRTTDERVCSQDDAALAYQWEIFLPPTLQGGRVHLPWMDNATSPVLRIPPSGLPNLEDTDAGPDTFWRVRLTVTPQPLDGEEFTPAPTVLWFRFRYGHTEMSLECYWDLYHDTACVSPECASHCGHCQFFPENCE